MAKRNKINWGSRVIRRKDSNGQVYYAYQYRTVHGNRRTKSLRGLATTYTQAVHIAEQLEERRKAGSLETLDPSRVTLDQIKDAYILARRGTIDKSSISRTMSALDPLIEYFGQGFLLRNLTSRKLSEWSGHRSRTGGKGNNPTGMKPGAVNSDLRQIRTVLNYAVEWGLLARAPKLTKVWLPDPAKDQIKYLMPDEVDQLLAAENNPEKRRFWIVYFYTGCRRVELVNLQGKDLHFDCPTPMIKIRGKGGRDRMVPVIPDVLKAIQAFNPPEVGPVFRFRRGKAAFMPPVEQLRQEARSASNNTLGKRYGASDSIICRWLRDGYPAGRQPHKDSVTHWFKAAARKAGLDASKLHDTRATTISLLLRKGVPLKAVQQIIGHKDLATTDIYARRLLDDNAYNLMLDAFAK